MQIVAPGTLSDIDAHDSGLAVAPARASEPLPQRGDRPRCSYLRDALDVANINSELQGRGAHGAGWQAAVAQARLDELSVSAGEIRVMGVEFVGHPDALRILAQQIGIKLDVAP